MASETFRRDGAVRLRGLIGAYLADWEQTTRPFFNLGKPGHRISGSPRLAELAHRLAVAPDFVAHAEDGWRCVRAIAFNKSPGANWSLGWHQDRTIAVALREDVPGFEVWSQKDGIPHVEPPFALLERMVTLRVHLDPVDGNNAPLLAVKGSHQLGKVAESAIRGVIDGAEIVACHAETGDGWLYATPVLHASARSTRERERRVIHLDFSRDALPAPLRWAGIG